jgi:hypothetical protein
MPKSAQKKPKTKQKIKPKRSPEPETPGITTRKSYWIMLAAVLAVVSGVLGYTSGLDPLETGILAVAVVVPVSCIGYIRISPSNLSMSKRATFLFIGISIIGFGIWAAIVLVGGRYGLISQLTNTIDSQFFVVTSLAICFSVGAVLGELIGRNKEIQLRLFNSFDKKD